jgi:uncharacterized protein YjiS (DUF1127 family)
MPAIARRLPLAGSSPLISVFRQIHRVIAIVADWHARARECRSLAWSDDRLLADIGLSREQQAEKCSISFWEVMLASNFPMKRNRINRSQNW